MSLMSSCTEGAQQNDVALFTGTVQKPWQMALYSGEQVLPVSANTHTLGALSYRTIDKQVQEDARKLSFDGSARAGMRLASESYFREDLQAKLGSEAVLSMQVRVEQAPSAVVKVIMNCESEGDTPGACHSEVDISEQLRTLPANVWQALSIDSQCFTKQGFKLAHTVVPFELTTQGVNSQRCRYSAAETNR